MRLSGQLALKVGTVGVVASAVLLPISAARAVTPPITGPAITVTPATGLTDGQSVTVAGTGFQALQPFVIAECSALPPGASCEPTNSVQGTTGADGSIPSTPFTVATGKVGDGTCPPAAASDSCYIVASTDVAAANPAKTATATITFGTAPPSPKVIVTPTTGVKDGDTITLSGADFAPSTGVFAEECAGSAAGPPPAQADCDGGSLATSETDSAGVFGGLTMVVHTGAVGDKTCDAGGECEVVVTTSVTAPDATNSGVGTFTFASATTPPPPPAKHHATKTKAKFSSKNNEIAGTVSSAGTGVKGLKTELEIKHGHNWKKVDTAKTHSGGAFAYENVTKSGTYEVKALKNATYKGSTSNKLTV